MVTNIQKEFENSIVSSSWIDPTTRERALKKLKSMKKLLGYPDTLTNKSDLDTFYKDVGLCIIFSFPIS
jgi:predicted metalloendopeptidase